MCTLYKYYMLAIDQFRFAVRILLAKGVSLVRPSMSNRVIGQ